MKQTGIVAANLGKQVEILTPSGEIVVGELASDLGIKPVAGDHVEYTQEGDSVYLVSVAPRGGVIRRTGRREGEERILAAHVEMMLIVSAVEPELKEGLIDRYIVAAEHEGIKPVVVLNKIDLDPGPFAQRIRTYEKLGYPTFCVNARTGENVPQLTEHIRTHACVLVGHSGVGKSTLLMALLPGAEIDTAEVSDYSGKGVHTTTTARLWTGPDGLRIIDSPGIRAFGLFGIEPIEIRDYFCEFTEHAPHCRFRDCLHLADEGCAVQAALDRGEIGKLRYESYRRIVESLS